MCPFSYYEERVKSLPVFVIEVYVIVRSIIFDVQFLFIQILDNTSI